VMILSTN